MSASGSLTGNFSGLVRITKTLDVIASVPFMTKLGDKLARSALDLIDKGFRAGEDPDGHPWKRKAVPDGKAPLHGATGMLSNRANWVVKQVDSTRIRVGPKENIAKRAGFAQGGTGLYGPKGRPFSIRPKNKRALSWISSGGVRLTRMSAMNKGAPQRRMVPTGGKLPIKWDRAFRSTINLYVRAHFSN